MALIWETSDALCAFLFISLGPDRKKNLIPLGFGWWRLVVANSYSYSYSYSYSNYIYLLLLYDAWNVIHLHTHRCHMDINKVTQSSLCS
jgi:hypothetical protein